MALAKRALLRPVGARHKEERLARFEAALLEAVNQTGIGAMRLGGKTTALDMHIKIAGAHLTSLPVAVNFQCWRRGRRGRPSTPMGGAEIFLQLP
jgi:fumarate hydratase subunit alpha